MKVLVVGGGGREHAIVTALAKSPKIQTLYCAPGNGGIAELAECVPIKAADVPGMVKFAQEKGIDFVVIAPENPLSLGMADEMTKAGIRTFGPSQAASIIEGSKAFSKELMAKYNIPTARYAVFEDAQTAIQYIREQGAPIVVKCDGLALGKGVVVAQTVAEAEDAVRAMMEDGQFGESGAKVVIEECMTGPEVTVLAFVDGKTIRPMLSAQDHKRVFDGDLGSNTGGMGAFSPSPKYTAEIADICMETIFRPTVEAMAKEGRPFKGVLYFGLMLTPEGPKVIEYNARFGDPEAQVVLELLETDLLEIFEAVADERLAEIDIQWSPQSACCVTLAAGNYPEGYDSGKPITGLDQVPADITVYHGSTMVEDGVLYINGGRILSVTAKGDTLAQAVKRAYAGVEKVHFDGMHYRRDIGSK